MHIFMTFLCKYLHIKYFSISDFLELVTVEWKERENERAEQVVTCIYAHV